MEKNRKFPTINTERQLGAFYYLYLNHFKKTPPSLSGDDVKFRNDVTHKGKMPKYDKSTQYAKKVYEYISKLS
jgi:hypothetical protein